MIVSSFGLGGWGYPRGYLAAGLGYPYGGGFFGYPGWGYGCGYPCFGGYGYPLYR